MRGQKSGFASLLPPIGLAICSLAAAAAISLQPAPHGPLAAVFPPWWSAQQAVIAASSAGAVVRFGALPFIVITAPGAAAAALRQNGAWLVLNPAFLGACGA